MQAKSLAKSKYNSVPNQQNFYGTIFANLPFWQAGGEICHFGRQARWL
jgi:hypothetical protein